MTFDNRIDPDERRDYTWDWAAVDPRTGTARLLTGETITSYVIHATACTTDSPTQTTTTVTVWVSAAQPRSAGVCSITCHVTTSGGRQYDDTILLVVGDR